MNHHEINTAICKMLKIDPEKASSVTIKLSPNDWPLVEIVRLVDYDVALAEDDEMMGVVESFRLVSDALVPKP